MQLRTLNNGQRNLATQPQYIPRNPLFGGPRLDGEENPGAQGWDSQTITIDSKKTCIFLFNSWLFN